VINSRLPVPALRRLVRYYYQVEGFFEAATALQPVPARSPEIIEFMFAAPYQVERIDSGTRSECWPIALVGPRTHHGVNLHLDGKVDAFTIAFRPGAVQALFGVPSSHLTNTDFDAPAVLGPDILRLHQDLGEASTLTERAALADAFLLLRCPDFDHPGAAVRAARVILRCGGSLRIDKIAARSGLGLRHFERIFTRDVGISPKRYARIVRFEAALRLKAASSGVKWTEIAHTLGYHDQMHMIHDFRSLSGYTPNSIIDRLDMFVKPEVEARR
jgi:AraC-like DNA-binding protein